MEQQLKRRNQGAANLLLAISMAAYFGVSIVIGVVIAFTRISSGGGLNIPSPILQLVMFAGELALIVPAVIFFAQNLAYHSKTG